MKNQTFSQAQPNLASSIPEGDEESSKPNNCVIDDDIPWRSSFSKIDIWYGSYGSNMWKPRFLCYLQGGKAQGMNDNCIGSRDTTLPKGIIWKTLPHRLFFGKSSSRFWGPGGVAFLHPETSDSEKSHICLYKITLEQFNDLLHQENSDSPHIGTSPLFGLSDMDLVAENKYMVIKELKGRWYSSILYLGKEDGLPIVTMTCSSSDVKLFKSGGLPLNAPGKDYASTLTRGLVEGEQLTEEQAVAYLQDAAARQL